MFEWIEHGIYQNQNLVPPDLLLWLLILSVSIFLSIATKAILVIVAKQIKNNSKARFQNWVNVFYGLAKKTSRAALFVAIISIFILQFGIEGFAEKFVSFLTVSSICFQVLVWGQYLIKLWRSKYLDIQIQNSQSAGPAIGLFYTFVQFGFFVAVLLTGLKAIGVNITALVAGLGVGGIAVALAAQNILGDLLASLSIVLDKPFEIGDFIVTGDEKGTVEYIGIKTTRLRSLSGEQVVVSNKDLLESRVKNFKRMAERRVVIRIGVIYGTSAEKLRAIPILIKKRVDESPMIRFERCHFDSFGESSLDFELVFHIESADYLLYMDKKQKLMFEILEDFRKEQIEFAFPTRSVFFENQLKSSGLS